MSLIIIIIELCEHVKGVLLVKIFPCWRAPLCQMLGSDKIYWNTDSELQSAAFRMSLVVTPMFAAVEEDAPLIE